MDISYCRLPLHFPVAAQLLASVEALSADGWLPHVNRACYDGRWDVYPLRGLAKHHNQSPILQAFALEGSDDAEDFADYAALSASPELADFLSQLCCPILSVRLMRLRPGSVIAPHRDHGLCFSQGQARLHLCLQTDPDVEFVVAGESIHMAEGELWYLNADQEHAVYHRGKTDRIHVVVDCIANDWLRNQLGIPEQQTLSTMSLEQRFNWLAGLTSTILSCSHQERFSLRQPIRELATSFAELIELELHPDIFLDNDFTITTHGKAVSMTTAAQCAEEFLRTAVFIRGIDQAIAERVNASAPVTVLYAGTGPFAMLLLPLLQHYSAQQLQVTLLDIHQASLNGVKQLLEAFNLSDRIAHMECVDATQWHSDQQFDLIVSETMKAGLATEPQVSIFAHLVSLLKPSGSLIPQQIELSTYVLDQQGSRTRLTAKVQLERLSALEISKGNTHALDMRVVLPSGNAWRDIEIRTDIQVYDQHRLQDHDCSLNFPLLIPLPQPCLSEQGSQTVQLCYLFSADPGYSLSTVSTATHAVSTEG